MHEVDIPDGITRIGDYAFDCCRELTHITIPYGVTSIGGMAFWQCESLERIVIPETVKNIGNKAFAGCFRLKEFVYGGRDIPFTSANEITMELILQYLS